VRLPFLVDLYQWQIETMDKASAKDRMVALKHSSRKQSLANVEKRSRGQLKGIYRAGIVARRQNGEDVLQQFIESDSTRRAKYGKVLGEIEATYNQMRQDAFYRLNLNNYVSSVRGLGLAFTIYDAAVERAKGDLDRETAYMDRNMDRTVDRAILGWKDWHHATDKVIAKGFSERLGDSKFNLDSSTWSNTALTEESTIRCG